MSGCRYPIFIAAVLVLGATTTFAAGLLSLPADPVVVTHGLWNDGVASTIDVTLSSVPPGYNVTNGIYAGWCVEDNHQSDAPPGSSVTLLDSTDEDPLVCAPGGFADVPWDHLNYLLNHQQGTQGDIPATIEDVQAALWIVAGTDDPGNETFPVTPEVNDLVTDVVLNGTGFTPESGDVAAVILCADGLGPSGYQDTIIEVPVTDLAPIFADGFESGDTAGWTAAVP
jgi:hypothetical protein